MLTVKVGYLSFQVGNLAMSRDACSSLKTKLTSWLMFVAPFGMVPFCPSEKSVPGHPETCHLHYDKWCRRQTPGKLRKSQKPELLQFIVQPFTDDKYCNQVLQFSCASKGNFTYDVKNMQICVS
jgi:hypothetical protein